jgi:hypothetical protein
LLFVEEVIFLVGVLQQQVDRMKGKASEEIENNETHPTTTKKRLLDYGYTFKNLTSTNSKLADHGKEK